MEEAEGSEKKDEVDDGRRSDVNIRSGRDGRLESKSKSKNEFRYRGFFRGRESEWEGLQWREADTDQNFPIAS